MSAVAPGGVAAHGHEDAPGWDFPPVTPLTVASLAAVLVGGILMAASFPNPSSLIVPVILLGASFALWCGAVGLLRSVRGFRWDVFAAVARWSLLAYGIIAGMIEFAFVHNNATGAPLVVLTLMLVMFALIVTLSIASTVARFANPAGG